MSLLADATQPYLAAGLLTLRGRVNTSLDTLISEKIGFVPTFDSTSMSWNLNFQSPGDVLEFAATECARFACASFQTFCMVATDLGSKDSVPWALVRAYYAAYYSAHSILRALGLACSFIDVTRIQTMNRVAVLYGVQEPFRGGLHEISIDSSGGGLDIVNVGGNQGGSHDAFWDVFCRRLQRMEAEVLAGPLPTAEAQAVNVALGELRQVVGRRRFGTSWLSHVRNTIQYKHGFNIWYPVFGPTNRQIAEFKRLARAWRSDPIACRVIATGGDELPTFISACTFIVAWCRTLLIRINERASTGRSASFLRTGPMRYLDALHSRLS